MALLACGVWACDDDGGQSGQGDGTGNNAVNNAGNNDTNNDTNNDAPDAGDDSDGDDMVCQEGERRCADATQIEVCTGGVFVAGDVCADNELCEDGTCSRRAECEPGMVFGCADDTSQRVCNEEGTAFASVPCPDDLNCIDGQCTDAVCLPGRNRCVDRDTIEVCNDDGTAYLEPELCPEGSLCLDGGCLSGCDLSAKFPSYIGCRYWSLDLDQYNDPGGDPSVVPHAVVFSNPSDQEAVVQVTTMANVTLPETEVVVPPRDIAVYTFPRLDVDGTGISNHSFFLESSWPVVAYQFNPLDNEGVASNDASLLLPVAALGQEYIAMSWPTTPIPEALGLPPQHGYITIVATTQGSTQIQVTPTANVNGGSNVPFLPAGETQTFTLRQFQVLNLEADGSNLFQIQDLTGTVVISDKPIAVFGGHEEAVVGEGCCAEHLEQQMYPIVTWGTRYLAAQSSDRGGAGDVWRVVASVDGTVITTNPPQADANGVTLNRGEYLQIQTRDSFEISGTGPIMVGQYLESQEGTAQGIGDPAFILAAPIDSFRDSYAILTPADYTEDWLTIMRPAGTPIRLDGQPVSDASFVPFGSGEYEYAWVAVQDGPHTVEGDAPFSLTAYGYSAAVSYGYSGGMNLRVADPLEEEE